MIPRQQLQRILQKLPELSPAEQRQLFSALAKEIDEQSAEDGLFWLRWVSTRDEADKDNPIKPFPLHEEYTKQLWTDIDTHQVTVIAKSRQMFVTWLVACYMTWWARYRPNQAIYYQTQNWDDAVMMTCMPDGGFMGRCQFIENNLPGWMKVKTKETEGRIQYPNGSIIQSIAGKPNSIRGKTVSLYIGDEFAFMEEQDKVWTSVAPLVQKGAKAIIVSTPNGTSNQFATLWHGRPVGEEQVA